MSDSARYVTLDEASAASGIKRSVLEGLREYGEIRARSGKPDEIWLPDLGRLIAAAAISIAIEDRKRKVN